MWILVIHESGISMEVVFQPTRAYSYSARLAQPKEKGKRRGGTARGGELTLENVLVARSGPTFA